MPEMIPHPPVGVVETPIVISMFDATPVRNSESNWNGGLLELNAGDKTLATGDDIVVTKGIGKILLVVIASNDAVGDITITGDTVDRETGVVTVGDTDTITLDGNTTDNSTTAGKGGGVDVHDFVGAYCTSKWFTGSVTLSTTEVDLTDVDVYHVSFEQVNDLSDLVLDTIDASVYTTNIAAEFDAYIYTLHKEAGDKCDVHNHARLSIGTDGETAIADKYWRLRRGELDEAIDGTIDGFWVDIYYLNAGNTYCQNVTVKVWLTRTLPLDFVSGR
jgi:hypothetical protein